MSSAFSERRRRRATSPRSAEDATPPVVEGVPDGEGAADGRSNSEELTALYGRTSAKGAVATDLGCPACRGVLYVSVLGKHGWLSFDCRVGHAFSVDSLLVAKEEQLEQSLWAVVEVLEEIAQLYVTLARAEKARPVARINQRLARARRHLRVLRGLIETEGPAPAAASKKGRHAME
jgi:hypothetical protein